MRVLWVWMVRNLPYFRNHGDLSGPKELGRQRMIIKKTRAKTESDHDSGVSGTKWKEQPWICQAVGQDNIETWSIGY